MCQLLLLIKLIALIPRKEKLFRCIHTLKALAPYGIKVKNGILNSVAMSG